MTIAKWLYNKPNQKKLWISGCAILLLLVIMEFWLPLHSAFHAFDWYGFNAVFGFLSCVAMVIFAKLLGYLIKRPEEYYDHE